MSITITILGLLLLAETKLVLSDDPTVCDYQKCLDIVKPSVNCRNVPEAIKCAVTTLLNNPDCPQAVKDEAEIRIQRAEEYLKTHCNGTTRPCNIEACLKGIQNHGFTCSSVFEAVECVDATVLNNPGCPLELKKYLQLRKQEAILFLENCARQSYVSG